ncbi:MAG: hypothetical protein SAL07_20685 [Oscillatoria sp. PMC 1051.18]|nr:hypothetical protein [Oscillatoria sp. PMC 1050.18]MEC5032324.1 hypothetical protein [Oscillatoria sp. PMC 1051.18]
MTLPTLRNAPYRYTGLSGITLSSQKDGSFLFVDILSLKMSDSSHTEDGSVL